MLRTERQVHAARDAGKLKEHSGTPDTKGEIFTVNCPVPGTAPATFRACALSLREEVAADPVEEKQHASPRGRRLRPP